MANCSYSRNGTGTGRALHVKLIFLSSRVFRLFLPAPFSSPEPNGSTGWALARENSPFPSINILKIKIFYSNNLFIVIYLNKPQSPINATKPLRKEQCEKKKKKIIQRVDKRWIITCLDFKILGNDSQNTQSPCERSTKSKTGTGYVLWVHYLSRTAWSH